LIFAILLAGSAFGQQQRDISRIEADKMKENQVYGNDQSFDIETSISDDETHISDDAARKDRIDFALKLSFGVLAFGLLLVILMGFIIYKKNSKWDQEATRIFAVSVIVTAGLFLIAAGYSDQQIAPMFGLLGTIIGYLLGKSPPGEQDAR
jgi:hypothetical protein